MIFTAGSVLIIMSGYALVSLIGLFRKSAVLDIPLSWFIGMGWISFARLMIEMAIPIGFGLTAYLAILLVPVLAVYIKEKSFSGISHEIFISFKRDIFSTIKKLKLYEKLLLVFPILALALIILHGGASVTNGEDAIRYRAYHPMLVHNGFLNISNGVFFNGIWANYLMPFYWALNGSINPFFTKYAVILSVFMFFAILFFLPALNEKPRQGLYNVLLVFSIPFFIYHSTLVYMDLPLAIMFSLGYLYFLSYASSKNKPDLYASILFFTLAAFIKSNGIIIGLIGFGSVFLLALADFAVKREKPSAKDFLFSAPFLLHLAIREYYEPKLLAILGIAETAPETIMQAAGWESEIGQSEAITMKMWGVYHSMFSSGNFGIVFFLLIGCLILYPKKIIKGRFFWPFVPVFSVFLASFYYAIFSVSLLGFESVIHRALIILSAVSALFASFCLSSPEKENE